MATVRVNGVDLYYEIRGTGAPILGIHGTPSSAVLWVAAADVLANHGRCIVYDRRGFGRSTAVAADGTLDLADHVADAAALLDALDARPAVVIGRSTGGQIALELARRYATSVRALALLEPALFSVDAGAHAWAADLRRRVLDATAQEPGKAGEFMIREALGEDGWNALPRMFQDLFAAASPAVLAEMRGHGLDLSDEPLTLDDDELAGVTQPTLVVSAADSPPVLRAVAERLVEAFPQAEMAYVPGGHLIDPAHPVVLGFVDRVLAGRE